VAFGTQLLLRTRKRNNLHSKPLQALAAALALANHFIIQLAQPNVGQLTNQLLRHRKTNR
jgi:hypothetical protein